MTKRSRSYIQTRFQNGDRPDEDDFLDLFESVIWHNDFPESFADNNAKKLTSPPAATAWSLSEGARLSLAQVADDVTVTITDDRDTLNQQLDQITIAFQQDSTGGRTLTIAGLTLTGGAVSSGKIITDATADAWTLVRLHRVNGAWYVVSSAFNYPNFVEVDTSEAPQTVEFSGVVGELWVFRRVGGYALTVLAGEGRVFAGGGTSITAAVNGVSVCLSLVGNTIQIVST
jgi:hypothetical protein